MLSACGKDDDGNSSGYGEEKYVSKHARSSPSAEIDSETFVSSASEKEDSDPSAVSSVSSAESAPSSSAADSENVSSDVSVSADEKTNSSKAQSNSSKPKTTITYYYYTTEDEDPEGEDISDNDGCEHSNSSQAESSAADTDSRESGTSSADDETDTDKSSDIEIPNEGEFTEDDLILTYGSTEITYGTDVNEMMAAMNEQPLHIYSIPNPDNSEFDIKIYSFEHFAVEAVPSDDGTSYFASGMEIFDDAISTNKGVHVGMTLDRAAAIYGAAAAVEDDEHRYYIGDKYMYLYVQNGIVANIGFGRDTQADGSEAE